MVSRGYWQRSPFGRRPLSRRAFLGAAGAATAGVVLTACGGDGDETPAAGRTPAAGGSPTVAPAGQPKSGGILTSVAAGSALHYDQHQHPGIVGSGSVYNQLLKLGSGQTIVKDLASGWETPEPTTYIFDLRRGVKFHDRPPVNGRDLLAEDVVYTIDRSRTDDPAFTNGWMWTELASLEAPDSHTVKATFNQPFAPALYHFAAGSMGVIAREVVEKFGDLKEWESRIGTGPFILEEVRRDDISRVRRNPEYFDSPLPYMDGIDTPVMPDRSTRIVAFRAGQIDMIPWQSGLSDMQEPARGMDDVTVLLRPNDAPTVLGFNHSMATLGQERVRKAISLAIDQQDLIMAAGGEDAGILVGMTHPHGEPFALPQEEIKELTKADVAEAKRLMSAAGYEDGFDLEMTLLSTDAISLDVAALMQQQLAQININLKLDPQEIATFVRKLFDWNFETIMIFSWTPALDPGQQFHGSLRTGAEQNYWNLSMPELDELTRQQVQEVDLEKRAALVRQLERLNFEKVATVPLYAVNGWIAIRNFIKDFDHLYAANGLGWQMNEVWLDK